VRIRKPGKITDHLWYLGREESGVYLLEGKDTSMIISGGVSCIVPDLLRQFKEFGIEESKIGKLLILHAHFDHVGIVPFLKRRHPELEVLASERGWQILSMPRAIETINTFSTFASEMFNVADDLSSYDLEWREDITGSAVSETDRIELGGVTASVIETPGHSSCSISAYVPELKALFASDGGGIPFRNEIITSGNSNYTQYQQSLEKLRFLDVEFICADHYGYVTGEEARNYIDAAIDAARKFRALMESVYKRKGSVDDAVKELVDNTIKTRPDYFLPREILTGVYNQMVKHIAKSLDNGVS